MKPPARVLLSRNRLYFLFAQATSDMSIYLYSGPKAEGWNRPKYAIHPRRMGLSFEAIS